MKKRFENQPVLTASRREALCGLGAGFGSLALSSLLQAEEPSSPQLKPSVLAKRCIFLFMYGGPCSVDTFDHKPELVKRNGQEVEIEIRRRSIQKQKLLAAPYPLRQRGESGLWCTEKLPHLAKHMDKLCLVKSLYSDSFAHGSALLQMNSGRFIQGAPTLGSWMTYGLGTENENIPAYVVMLDPRGGPVSGRPNWGSGFMPAAYQGTQLRSKGAPIIDLAPASSMDRSMQRRHIDALRGLNEQHRRLRPGNSDLEARIASYELAFQLQTSAPEVMDISGETRQTLDSYGIFDPKGEHKLSLGPAHFGRQCLIARRLVERGSRFVQIYSGGGHQQQNWDAHHGAKENLDIHGPEIDKPIAGLLTDLQQRGLLDETLVIWGGEFGRQPVSQNDGGRDHNPKGFLYWMAGGGVKGGHSHGELDELGAEAAVDRHHIRDLHATILHLMGLDHRKLTYFYGGLDHKLTGVQEANVIKDLIA